MAIGKRPDRGQSLSDAISWRHEGDGRFVANVDPVWGQGRAVYGGIVGAGMARAMAAAVSSDASLRSFSATFAGPVQAGEIPCATELVREGRTASFMTAEIAQDGARRATASAVFGAARESSAHTPGPALPDLPPPEACESMPYLDGLMPSFTQRVEYRYTHGAFPFMGGDGSRIGGWFRFRHDPEPGDGPGMLALIDTWPAPALSGMKTPAPASSITWSVDLFTHRLDARLDQWWYFDARTLFAVDGYTNFEASLWAPDGQYVARSSQLVGVFG